MMTKLTNKLYKKIYNQLKSYEIKSSTINPKRAILLISMVDEINRRICLLDHFLHYKSKEIAIQELKEIKSMYETIQSLKEEYSSTFEWIIDYLYPQIKEKGESHGTTNE
jgi:hypothetical protein